MRGADVINEYIHFYGYGFLVKVGSGGDVRARGGRIKKRATGFQKKE